MENLAPWRSPLASATECNSAQPHAHYFQLATVTSSGRPANRTLVFRGFWENTDQIEMVTDARSDKIEQIQNYPWGEICWYFTQTREQFRLAGQLTLVDSQTPDRVLQQERQQMWKKLSDRARLQFACPDPKQPQVGNPQEFVSPPTIDSPLSNFCLLLLDPIQVHRLNLDSNPHQRWLYTRQDNGVAWETDFEGSKQ